MPLLKMYIDFGKQTKWLKYGCLSDIIFIRYVLTELYWAIKTENVQKIMYTRWLDDKRTN